MALKQWKVAVPGFLFLLRSEVNWIALSNACLRTGIINSQADTDLNLGALDTRLKLGGIWAAEHQETSQHFPSLSLQMALRPSAEERWSSLRHTAKKVHGKYSTLEEIVNYYSWI